MHIVYHIMLVAAGSALGGLTRWGVGMLLGGLLGTTFPWATFAINVSGCLFLGWSSTFLVERLHLPAGFWLTLGHLRLFLAVGFTGAYTTFSTYELEAYVLVERGSEGLSILYLLASVVTGFVALWLGVWLARW